MMKVRKEKKFVSCFNKETGLYFRTGVIKDGEITDEDPFMSSFPELLDIGIMGHCEHGKSGLCLQSGVQCYQNGKDNDVPNMSLEDFQNLGDGYAVDTYVMSNQDGAKVPKLEDTRAVEAGMWVITNPVQQEGDRLNNFCQNEATFNKRYEATDEPGVYRAKGMARIIKNETGHKVVIDDPWGSQQEGDENCYFCVPYDPDHPFDVPEGKAYILSENDFANYGPAAEVREDYVPIGDYVRASGFTMDPDDMAEYYRFRLREKVAIDRYDDFLVEDIQSYYDGHGGAARTIPKGELGKHVRGMMRETLMRLYDAVPDNPGLYRRKSGAPTLGEMAGRD